MLGSTVRVTGLLARPDLNGLLGVVTNFNEDRGRFSVRFSDAAPLLLKAENLQLVKDPKPFEVGDVVQVVKQGDGRFEGFGKIITAEAAGALVQFSEAVPVEGFKYASLLQCSGNELLESASRSNPIASQGNALIQLRELTCLPVRSSERLLRLVGGDVERAMELHFGAADNEEALEEFERLMNRVFSSFDAGDRHAALQHWKACLQQASQHAGWRSKEIAGRVCGCIGTVYNQLGEHHQAIEYISQAMAIRKGLGDTAAEAGDLTDLAKAYYFLGNLTKATDLATKALAICEAIRKSQRHGPRDFLFSLEGRAREVLERCDVHGPGRQAGLTPADSAAYMQVQRLLTDAQEQGDGGSFATAMQTLKDALQHAESIQSPDKKEDAILSCVTALAAASASRSDYDGAMEYASMGISTCGTAARHDQLKAFLGAMRKDMVTKRAGATETYDASASSDGGFKVCMHTLNQGQEAVLQSNFESAITLYEQTNSLTRTLGDASKQASISSYSSKGLGDAYFGLGDYAVAASHYECGLAGFQRIGEAAGEAMCTAGLGSIYIRMGQTEKAIQSLETARAHFRAGTDVLGRLNEAQCYNSLGVAHIQLGWYVQAQQHVEAALTICDQYDDSWPQLVGAGDRPWDHKGQVLHLRATALGTKGSICHKLGQYEKAIEHQRSAYALSQKANDVSGQAGHLAAIGNAHRQLGQLEQARAHLTQSLARSECIKDRLGIVITTINLGNVCRSLKLYDEATTHLQAALKICREAGYRREVSSCLIDLGVVATCQLEPQTGAAAPRAEHTSSRPLSYFREALQLAEATAEEPLIAAACHKIGAALLLVLKDAAGALSYLLRASTIHSGLWSRVATDHERISFGNTSGHVSSARLLQRAYLDLERHADALVAAESTRARSLEVLLARQRLGASSSSSKPAGIVKTLCMQDIREVAASQGATIVFFSQLTPGLLVAWVVTPAGALSCKEIHLRADEHSIAKLIEITRHSIGASTRSEFVASRPPAEEFCERDIEPIPDDAEEVEPEPAVASAPAVAGDAALIARCYDLLFAPLASALEGSPELLLIPDGDLYALPFVALFDSSSGQYLIERHSIRLAPSIGMLRELRASAPVPACRSLVVGGPDYSGWRLSATGKPLNQLPGAAKEAAVVNAKLRPRDEVVLLRGAEATKAAAVESMPFSAYIHFATHGSPQGVFLAGSSEADATLSMAEIEGMSLCARLVVLSACDTFRGELGADGLIGISRSFLAAGAHAVVASLWKVDDEATCLFMDRLYGHLLTSECTTAKAFQRTVVELLRDANFSILQWAAFNVFGSDCKCSSSEKI